MNCLNGVPANQVLKRDPARTLRSVKQTGFKPTLAIPVDDRPTSVWEVLDSPLRFEGLVLLTAGTLGLVLTRTPARKRVTHRVIDSWDAATVRPSSRVKQLLGDLGFVRPVLTGAIDDVDLVGEFDPTVMWSYVVLARG